MTRFVSPRCGACLGLLVLLAAAPPVRADVDSAVLKAEQERIAAIDKAKRTAVSVFAAGGRGGGSGVVITPDGYALTNFHVVKPAGTIMHCSMPDEKLYEAVIVGIDPVGDVALIKLLGRDDFPCAELADSDTVQVGDYCFAVGNPFLLATDFQPTVTWGLVSGVHRYQYPAGTLLEYADCIQTDAAINPGNSGGPLFNAQGQLIGINGRGSFEKRGRVNVGVGYAISINQIKHFMGCLRAGRIVDHATLGASVSSDEDGRVVVTNILETSDAYRRGLRYADEVVAFGGRSIYTVNGFKNALGIFPKGWRAPLSFRRDGKQYDVFVQLTGVHPNDELINKVQAPEPEIQPGRPMPGRPMPGRPMPGRPMPGRPMPGQPGDDPQQPEEDKPDGEKPEGEQPAPKPIPLPLDPGAAPQQNFSAEAKKLYVERRGYANYYFNELNRDRVWKSLTDNYGDFASLPQAWKMEGELAGAPVSFTIAPDAVRGTFPGGPAAIETGFGKDLDVQLDPPGSGGLLAALHIWQRMLTVGPKGYGDVYYYGTLPLPEREGVFDTLSGTYNVIDSRFLFDPSSGEVVAVEFIPSADSDSCEVRFGDYRDVDGRKLPHRMEVKNGDRLFGVITIKSISFSSQAE